jgi:hypothetical protein
LSPLKSSMTNPLHILDNPGQFFSGLLNTMLWAMVKGLLMGIWLAIKLLCLPFAVILLGWIALRLIMRWIDEGEFYMSFEWLTLFARWFSNGWHQTWWGALIIGAAGNGFWALIAKIFSAKNIQNAGRAAIDFATD